MISVVRDGRAFNVKVGVYNFRFPVYKTLPDGFHLVYFAKGPEGDEELFFKPLKGDAVLKARFRKKKGEFQREVYLSSLKREDLESLERYASAGNWHDVIDLVLFDTLIDEALLEVEWG